MALIWFRGGLFAGKLKSIDDKPEPGSRFDGETYKSGGMYRKRYLKDGFFQAMELIKEAAVSVCHYIAAEQFMRVLSRTSTTCERPRLPSDGSSIIQF